PQSYVPQKPVRRPAAVAAENGAARTTPASDAYPVMPDTPRLINEIGDDRDSLEPGKPILLIVENDLAFARLVLEAAREKGFKGLVTSLGAAALVMTTDFSPDAIILDICLPDIDGWRVMHRLKNDITMRHIPVCVISTEDVHDRALGFGAVSVLTKPFQNRETLEKLLDTIRDFIGRPFKDLLIVGD